MENNKITVKDRILLECGIAMDITIETYPDRKMTVAKAEGCEDLARYSLNNIFRSIDEMTIQENSLLWKKLTMKRIYVAVARCLEPDVFNAEEGRGIAVKKLKDKLDEKVSNRRYTIAKELYAMAIRCSPPQDGRNLDRVIKRMEKRCEKQGRKENDGSV